MSATICYALEGKIVTMDAAGVLERGVVYVRGRDIDAVQDAEAAPPAGFGDAPLVRTGGTLYPGLIDLYRRPAYGVLPLPLVPRQFEDQDQWEQDPDWHHRVEAPLQLLLDTPHCRLALARYHEAACLLAGVTSAPGLILGDTGIEDAPAAPQRSLVRCLEAPGDPALPPAIQIEAANVALAVAGAPDDADAPASAGEPEDSGSAGSFLAVTGRERPPAALSAADFEALVEFGATLVWTPLADLTLFGRTVELDTARAAGLALGLGSGASPLGSRNLLEELKVAYLYGRAYGSPFSAQDLVAMVTAGAARALRWEAALGSLAPGKWADLLVVDGRDGNPYERLLQARESSVALVVVDGVPVCGQERLMAKLGAEVGDSRQAEALTVGRARRIWNLAAGPGDGLGPGRACSLLRAALRDMPALAQDLGPAAAERIAGVEAVPKLDLAPLTVVDGGGDYFERLAAQPNLPGWLKEGLPPFYGRGKAAAGRPLMPDPALADFVRGLHPEVQAQFVTAFDLAAFLQTAGRLSLEDRRGIVEQALVLLERIYVHLPLKRAMHAIDPVQRLRLLKYHLEEEDEEDLPSELAFHNELTEIFTSTRDLHTNYLLPRPYRDKTAFLPFMVEEYYDEEGRPHYLVSKIVGQGWPESFRPGVELLYWNGVPIRRAVEVLAAAQAGGNPDARHARALDSLTIRPLVRLLPPDEEWVTLHYRGRDGHGGGDGDGGDEGDDGGQVHEVRHRWRVFTPEAGEGGVAPDALRAEAAVLGFDLQTDAIHQVKKVLYAPEALAAERRIARAQADRLPPPAGMSTNMPTVFRSRRVPDEEDGPYGYIRIFTFNVDDAGAFVDEFVRLARLLPPAGLIVDVRGNGGGLIYAAERLLQVLTPRRIEPEPAQFLNTPLALDLCRRHRPSRLLCDFDLGPWIKSIAQAVRTGATYSRGFAITPPEACNDRGQQYSGPVLLITDALCYSATDIFSAGFQDHDIGPILGTSGNTGAGGANVW
ncbi:MAG: S41 family peptidase, partial [Anaerolineae bacterium]